MTTIRLVCLRKLPKNPLDSIPVVARCSYGESEKVSVFTAFLPSLPITLPILKDGHLKMQLAHALMDMVDKTTCPYQTLDNIKVTLTGY